MNLTTYLWPQTYDIEEIWPKLIFQGAPLLQSPRSPPGPFCYSEPLQRSTDMAGKSLNRVQLIGNLGKDPEIKYTPQGTPVAKLTIATNERFKDKAGEWQDRTEWHNVVLWQRLAEIAGEYLKKGGKVYIEGRLQTRSWDDKTTGQKKYMTEVVASDLILLGGRGEGGGGGDFAGSSRGASSSAGGGGNNFDQRTPEPEPAGSGPITDDDIPF
jgi:single-strand DNA-binding protein